MRTFTYLRPADTAGALAGVGGTAGGGRYLAGGTNLVDLMKLGVEEPRTLVDVNHLGMGDVSTSGDGTMRIGAGVRNSDLAADPTVRRRYPVLSEALLAGASGQLRNVATVGGNLLQRTRCRYFQDLTTPCNKRDPGSGCPAIDGDHRHLAILGTSASCVATHPSDMAVAMLALDASVEHTGAAGPAHTRLDDLYRLPGDEPQRDTNLPPGDLITAVVVPPAARGARSGYVKARERASFAFALASVAAVISLRDGRIGHVSIALGGVAHRPWRASLAEEALAGATPGADAFARAMDAEMSGARPLRDNSYKVALVTGLATRLLCHLAGIEGPTW